MALFASTWAAFLAPLPTSMATLLGGNRLALMPASRTLLPLCQQSYGFTMELLRFCGWQPSTAGVSAASYAKPCSLRATRILSILTLTPSLQLGSKLASISCFNSAGNTMASTRGPRYKWQLEGSHTVLPQRGCTSACWTAACMHTCDSFMACNSQLWVAKHGKKNAHWKQASNKWKDKANSGWDMGSQPMAGMTEPTLAVLEKTNNGWNNKANTGWVGESQQWLECKSQHWLFWGKPTMAALTKPTLA